MLLLLSRSKQIVEYSAEVPADYYFLSVIQQAAHALCFLQHKMLLLCYLRVPFQLASLPGFQVIHIPKGNPVLRTSGTGVAYSRTGYIPWYVLRTSISAALVACRLKGYIPLILHRGELQHTRYLVHGSYFRLEL